MTSRQRGASFRWLGLCDRKPSAATSWPCGPPLPGSHVQKSELFRPREHAQVCPRLPWGEERANILLLACCNQEDFLSAPGYSLFPAFVALRSTYPTNRPRMPSTSTRSWGLRDGPAFDLRSVSRA